MRRVSGSYLPADVVDRFDHHITTHIRVVDDPNETLPAQRIARRGKHPD